MKTRKDTVRRLYREAILKYFGANLTKDDDKYLSEALKRDVHIAHADALHKGNSGEETSSVANHGTYPLR